MATLTNQSTQPQLFTDITEEDRSNLRITPSGAAVSPRITRSVNRSAHNFKATTASSRTNNSATIWNEETPDVAPTDPESGLENRPEEISSSGGVADEMMNNSASGAGGGSSDQRRPQTIVYHQTPAGYYVVEDQRGGSHYERGGAYQDSHQPRRIVVVGDGNCPVCGIGYVSNTFSFIGILFAILCFPCGIICCLLFMVPQCNYCGSVF